MARNSGTVEGTVTGLAVLIVLVVLGLLGYWMFQWSTHTLVWVAAFFGTVLGVGRATKS